MKANDIELKKEDKATAIIGQLVAIAYPKHLLIGVVIEIFDDRYWVEIENGGYTSIITDSELYNKMGKKDLVGDGMATLLFKNKEPVMSGKKKVGFFRRQEVYTFHPIEG